MKKENINKIKNHAELVSASPSFLFNKGNNLINNNGEAGDPECPQGGHHFITATKAFTLIELLVVVLIIGILAAVAVPQYNVAVAKSRVSAILPLISTLAKAEETYYMGSGQYSDKLDDLDITLPDSCQPVEDESAAVQLFKCDNYFLISYDPSAAVNASYCPNNNNSQGECDAVRDLLINFRLLYRTTGTGAGKHYCTAKNKSGFGKKVCSSLQAVLECSNC